MPEFNLDNMLDTTENYYDRVGEHRGQTTKQAYEKFQSEAGNVGLEVDSDDWKNAKNSTMGIFHAALLSGRGVNHGVTWDQVCGFISRGFFRPNYYRTQSDNNLLTKFSYIESKLMPKWENNSAEIQRLILDEYIPYQVRARNALYERRDLVEQVYQLRKEHYASGIPYDEEFEKQLSARFDPLIKEQDNIFNEKSAKAREANQTILHLASEIKLTLVTDEEIGLQEPGGLLGGS